MIGHGVFSFSSHSCAAGRTTSAAKPCTQSRMSFWSWVSASENVTSWLAAPAIASTAASAASVTVGLESDDMAVGGADIGGDLLLVTGRLERTGPGFVHATAADTLDIDRAASTDRLADHRRFCSKYPSTFHRR